MKKLKKYEDILSKVTLIVFIYYRHNIIASCILAALLWIETIDSFVWEKDKDYKLNVSYKDKKYKIEVPESKFEYVDKVLKSNVTL